ncbi:hypothetical protein ACFCX0_26645 [Streptomyces sp. NPDC056352]|uniref:hypothetical protein n=1 Tax=Streptomyces sp. NPDC056352 TaxID=3345791 RepID=UPI0035D79940
MIDQSYIADDGTEYAICTTGRDSYRPDARQIFDTALSTWTLDDSDRPTDRRLTPPAPAGNSRPPAPAAGS